MTSDDKGPTRADLQRKRRVARERFQRARRAEHKFGRSLRGVAREVGNIVKGFAPNGDVADQPSLLRALRHYSEMLRPWAESVAKSMVAEVAQRDEHAWEESAREIGRTLRNEVRMAPTGERMRGLMAEQVDLITSLPLEAATRVHKLTVEAMSGGTRSKEIAKEILRSGKVTEVRANLIARTEVGRTAASMTQARAEFIGSEGYIWRTAGDADVRKLHKELNGTFVKWSEPPIAGEAGERAHAGAIYNCRCYAEPVIPESV